MPATQSPRFDSSRLLLSAGIMAAASPVVAMSTMEDMLTAFGGAQTHHDSITSYPELQDRVKKHPEWSWLPGYKWNALSTQPYTLAGRSWEALSGEIAPVASTVALYVLTKQIGLQYQKFTKESGLQFANLAWRLGEAVGDISTTNSSPGLMWRLFASNIDLLMSPDSSSNRSFWFMRRLLAYAPVLIPSGIEAMRQHVLHQVGYAGIAFAKPSLNEHFALTLITSSSADDPGRPNSAYLDLDFIHQSVPYSTPKGSLEKALVNLDTVSREKNLTRIRFYPAIMGDQRRGGKLVLYVRPYFNHQPGPLIRFPASFGSSNDKIWVTDAVDRNILQGVYNDSQYTAVKYFNELMGYGKSMITPFSDLILETLPELVRWSADQPTARNYGHTFEEQMHLAETPENITVDDTVNFGLPAKPKQSAHHTVVSLGKKGIFFFDDYWSQRKDLPIITINTEVSADDIKQKAIDDLEDHLAWQPYHGAEKIFFTLGKGAAYSWVTSNLMKARNKALNNDLVSSLRYAQAPDYQTFGKLKDIDQLAPTNDEWDDAIEKARQEFEQKDPQLYKTFDDRRQELDQKRADLNTKEGELAGRTGELAGAQTAHNQAAQDYETIKSGLNLTADEKTAVSGFEKNYKDLEAKTLSDADRATQKQAIDTQLTSAHDTVKQALAAFNNFSDLRTTVKTIQTDKARMASERDSLSKEVKALDEKVFKDKLVSEAGSRYAAIEVLRVAADANGDIDRDNTQRVQELHSDKHIKVTRSGGYISGITDFARDALHTLTFNVFNKPSPPLTQPTGSASGTGSPTSAGAASGTTIGAGNAVVNTSGTSGSAGGTGSGIGVGTDGDSGTASSTQNVNISDTSTDSSGDGKGAEGKAGVSGKNTKAEGSSSESSGAGSSSRGQRGKKVTDRVVLNPSAKTADGASTPSQPAHSTRSTRASTRASTSSAATVADASRSQSGAKCPPPEYSTEISGADVAKELTPTPENIDLVVPEQLLEGDGDS